MAVVVAGLVAVYPPSDENEVQNMSEALQDAITVTVARSTATDARLALAREIAGDGVVGRVCSRVGHFLAEVFVSPPGTLDPFDPLLGASLELAIGSPNPANPRLVFHLPPSLGQITQKSGTKL